MDSTVSQQMFDLWKRQMEEAAQGWSRLLGQSPAAPPDPATFWRPFVEQWVQACAQSLARTPITPDLATQWKQFLDQSVEAWSRAIGQAMNTESFARMLGRYLDQWLSVAAPMKRVGDQAVETALETLNLP